MSQVSFADEMGNSRARGGSLSITPQTPTAKEAHRRSLAKAVSWRITGSVDTFVLSFLITGSIKIAGSISIVEIVTKIVLFYFHERIWGIIRWGKTLSK
jgi:uncharacterized membrane protein